jgi:hypothetical protein
VHESLKPETCNLKHRGWELGFLFLALLLAGCTTGKSPSLTDVFAGGDAFPGWTLAGEVEVYDRENLYELVDGQADALFAYGFEQVVVQRYGSSEGAELDVEVWQLATPADAYGLFTAQRAGAPVAIALANDGDADPGRRLAFWQDRYTVQVRARQELNDAELRGLAEALSAALPSGGGRPALVGRLPPEGLVERSEIFFHEEISIQSEMWLGGENVLGLGPETDGVLARYDVGGATVRLLLVQYPDAETASDGLAALEAGQVSNLVAADVRDGLLGAVFGETGEAAAGELLASALGDRQSELQ